MSATGAPDGSVASADEIARAALFVACDDASFITGEEPTVGGGLAAF